MNNSQRQVHATLKRAKALIEKHGWIQDAYGDKQHGFCAMGALNEATENQKSYYGWVDYRAQHLLSKAVKKEHIAEYNDAKRRTKSQVLKAFDRAIKLATTFDVDSI